MESIFILLTLVLIGLWAYNEYSLKPMLDREYDPRKEVLNPNSSMKLMTVNTIGLGKFGKFRKNGNTFVTYQCLTFFFFPIFPFGCYRIEELGDDQYRVYGSVKTSLQEILSLYLSYYTWLFAIIFGFCFLSEL